ncbi:MAG: hypothetical protein GTN71_27340 [Anaerolineae bacterium]|nr:hypothetical protein [Anaerolineae bacterium]
MLKARWSGYEIDSSEAAYEVQVPRPEELGTLVRSFLTSGYFVKSYYSLFEEPLERLRDFIKEHGDPEDQLAAKALEQLDKQIAKFDPSDWRAPRIGVRTIEPILNYVGAHRQELLDAQVFRFELTDEQKEMYEDYDYEFEVGQEIDDSSFYSEDEIPFDGTVLYLGCNFVKASKLTPAEQRKARRIARRAGKRMDEFGGPGMFGESWADMLESDLERSMNVTLRVRLNPDATLSITGRWMEDGQFLHDYYAHLLDQAAEKAGAEIGTYVL